MISRFVYIGRSLGGSPRPILAPMGDLLARLQSALGDACRIEKKLVGCGMSRVFLATDASLQQKVVIKLLPPEFAGIVLDGRRNAH